MIVAAVNKVARSKIARCWALVLDYAVSGTMENRTWRIEIKGEMVGPAPMRIVMLRESVTGFLGAALALICASNSVG